MGNTMNDNLKERKELAAFDAAVESAKLLGAADSKHVLGVFTAEDARFVVAMHQSIAKHRAAIEASRAAVPAGWVPLSDSQWLNIVNANNAWYGYEKSEAILEVVKLAEERLKLNNSAAPQPVAQPSECEWTNCPRRVGDVCCNDQAKPEQAAQQWQPIETAPKDGRTLLLGYFNSHNNWRTMRGRWMSEEYLAEQWEDPDNGEPGWFETAVEPDDVPNCWATSPTHWMPLPASPNPKD